LVERTSVADGPLLRYEMQLHVYDYVVWARLAIYLLAERCARHVGVMSRHVMSFWDQDCALYMNLLRS
jgi:hypothetical protein